MKRLSVVLLILVLVAGSVFAAVTPEFSGRFRFGYKFAFGNESTKIGDWKTPAQLKLKIAFGTDVWQINLKDFRSGALDSNDKIGGNLTFNIDKVADMGDHKLAVNMGYNSDMTALTAFNDVTGDEYYKFKNNGRATFEARYGYADIVNVNLTVDPTDVDVDSATAGRSFMISAKGKIVDGVTLAAQYGFRAKLNSYTTNRIIDAVSDIAGAPTYPDDVKSYEVKNGFGASVGVDIAKLAGLDFILKFSAHDNWGKGGEIGTDNTFNSYVANIEGGVDAVSGYAEFAVETDTTKVGDNKEKTNYLDLAFGVNVNVLEELPIKVGFKFNDLANASEGMQTWRVSAEATYKVLGLELAYARATKAEVGAFVIIPKMVLSF